MLSFLSWKLHLPISRVIFSGQKSVLEILHVVSFINQHTKVSSYRNTVTTVISLSFILRGTYEVRGID